MVRFSNLPDDIILELWKYILHPDDIKSFALVSRSIYALGHVCLKEHRRLKAQYSLIQTSYRSQGCGKAWGDLLKDILLNPHLAPYVTTLDVCPTHLFWEQDYGHSTSGNDLICHHVPYPKTDMLLFQDALRKLGEVEDWSKDMEAGDEDPIIAILLTLLPGLRTLRIKELPLNGVTFGVIQYIAEYKSTTMLSELEEVEISYDQDFESKDTLVIRPFAMLPSMKKLSCSNFKEDWSPYAAESRMPLQISNISELTITGNDISSKNLFEILGGFKALKRFAYLEPAASQDFDPFWIRAALVAYARHSLEQLIIQYPGAYKGQGCMGDLWGFKRLRTLETEYNFLVEPGHYDVMYAAEYRHTVANALPGTLQELVLCGNGFDLHDQVGPSIHSLVEAKINGHLASLNKLEYRLFHTDSIGDDVEPPVFEDLDNLVATCESQCITLTI